MYYAGTQGFGVSIQEKVMNSGSASYNGSLINAAINANGTRKVVYARKSIDTSDPNCMKDSDNFTEYIGKPYSSDPINGSATWSTDIANAANWSNGLPLSIVAPAGKPYTGKTYYFIFVKEGTAPFPNKITDVYFALEKGNGNLPVKAYHIALTV